MLNVVRYVGKDRCSDGTYQRALAGDATVIDAISKRRNVVIRFELDEHPLRVATQPDVRDLLECAATVYVTDEVHARLSGGDRWTRDFRYVFPVQDVRAWTASSKNLERCLSNLSGDRHSFQWLERTTLPGLSKRHRRAVPRSAEGVCLFSGGVDSLLGAFHLLTAGKRLLLVGHQAEGATASVQKNLADSLRKLFPGQVRFIQARVSRSGIADPDFRLPAKAEDTHRPRSFLFLSLAVAIARSARVDQVYIPENGLIALNVPLELSRSGSLSTRTAHPRFLTAFTDFVHSAGIFEGTIQNPFLYVSKTDMLQGLEDRVLPLVQATNSCARPSRFRNLGATHCGYCVACLYRRAAFAAAGIDNRKEYAFDVLRGWAGFTTKKQRDFRALAEFATRVSSATALERQVLVLSHGYFPPNVGELIGPHKVDDHSVWADMLLRWAKNFLLWIDSAATKVVQNAVGRPQKRKAKR